jgi:hypothetical protein
MSRWKDLERVDWHLDEMSLKELKDALSIFQKQLLHLWGEALKGAKKRIHKIERAIELKRQELAEHEEE